jgi:plasmid stabilization system protein ParE
MRAEFHPEAIAELDASADWYAERSPIAVKNFLVAIDLAIETIESDPNRFPFIDSRHQSCSVMKFPFQVVFRRKADQLFIIAVAHAKRRPGYWRGR